MMRILREAELDKRAACFQAATMGAGVHKVRQVGPSQRLLCKEGEFNRALQLVQGLPQEAAARS
jgi:hypothetical protein